MALPDRFASGEAFGFLDGKSGLEELVLHSVNINMKVGDAVLCLPTSSSINRVSPRRPS